LTETAGLLAGGFKKFFNVATPTGTLNSLADAVPGAAGGGFIAGTNAATAITTALTANVTGNLSGSVGSVTGAVGSVTGAVGSVTGAVGSVTAGVTLAASAIQAIWDALTSALTTVGSIGKLLVDNITGNAFTRLGAPAGASVSADIAAVKAQTASIQVDTDDIQTRLPAALVSGRIDASVGAMAAGTVTAAAVATDAIDADALATDAVNEIADGLLNRDMAVGTDTIARSPRNALRFLRNKRGTAAGTLTVTKEDDVTSAWTAALTTDAAAVPVITVDPV
jgi:hypothetical protein